MNDSELIDKFTLFMHSRHIVLTVLKEKTYLIKQQENHHKKTKIINR